MKSKKLKIVFESWEKFKIKSKSELTEILYDGTKIIQDNDTIVFDSLLSYQRLMSEQKYLILAAIKNLKPVSLYQLAKIVDRDFANVKKDCETLETMGFIVLEESGDKRKTKIPHLVFDYNIIEIHLPTMTYSHFLGDVAA